MASTELGQQAEKLISQATEETLDSVAQEVQRLFDQAELAGDTTAMEEIQRATESLVMLKLAIEFLSAGWGGATNA